MEQEAGSWEAYTAPWGGGTAGGAANASSAAPPLDLDQGATRAFEQIIRIVVPVFFSLIALLGFAGNLMVIAVVVSNRQMRNTTNLLIISLALADLLFIVICVPFTALAYAIPVWPFGSVWCKIYQYMVHVTAYVSVYTLVLMSLDRYLAVVHPISSMTLRTQRNTLLAIAAAAALALALNAPSLQDFDVFEYEFFGETRTACIHLQTVNTDRRSILVFYTCFFVFAYALPLGLVCALYGLMLRRLLYGLPGGRGAAGGASGGGGGGPRQSAGALRSKRRVTRLCIVVVLVFALCWLPLQVTFLVQFVFAAAPSAGEEERDETGHVIVKIVSSCLAYMNSCVNPILYAFLSESFRKSFTRLLCPRSGAAGGGRGDERFRPLPISEPTRWARERPGGRGGEEGTRGGEEGTLLDGTQATTVLGPPSTCV